jgi:hypothetical protein
MKVLLRLNNAGRGAASNLPTAIELLGKIRERGIKADSERLNVQPYVLVGRRRSRHLALEVPWAPLPHSLSLLPRPLVRSRHLAPGTLRPLPHSQSLLSGPLVRSPIWDLVPLCPLPHSQSLLSGPLVRSPILDLVPLCPLPHSQSLLSADD